METSLGRELGRGKTQTPTQTPKGRNGAESTRRALRIITLRQRQERSGRSLLRESVFILVLLRLVLLPHHLVERGGPIRWRAGLPFNPLSMQWCKPVYSGLDPNADPDVEMSGRSHWTGQAPPAHFIGVSSTKRSGKHSIFVPSNLHTQEVTDSSSVVSTTNRTKTACFSPIYFCF